jgi:cyclopropane fatty-acyl-phospholipid synthase-like methyltransferase
MRVRRVVLPLLLSVLFAGSATAQQPALRAPDVIYVPTPHEVVEAMLKLAKVGPNDVVYDLGSGDGRIPIAAVQKFSAKKAVGVDINPERIKEAMANHTSSAVGDKVRFILGDMFEQDISEATVVTLYLLPSLNVKLMPKFKAELKPGTRIVSQSFDMMGQWEPEETVTVDGRPVYLWTIK